MKKFLKMLFSRMTFVIIAIILQIVISLILPYAILHYYPVLYGYLLVPLDIIFSILGVVFTIRIINSDMPTEGQLIWAILLLFLPLFGILIYTVFVRRKPPKTLSKC